MQRRTSQRMIMTPTAVACVLVMACLAHGGAAFFVGNVQDRLEAVRVRHSLSMYAGAVAAFDADGIRNDATAAFGTDPSVSKMSVSADSSLRANTQFDHLVLCVAVQTLVSRQILPQAQSTIPPQYLPRGVALAHPAFPGSPLTLRQLMSHTSALTTSSRFDPAPLVSGGSNAATDITTFANGYFATASGASFTQAQDIWTSGVQPGTDAAYSPSRANSVLLAFVLQTAIAMNPTLVTSSQKTAGAFIQEFVIAGIGMQSTYTLLPDGSVPRTQFSLTAQGGKKITERTAGGAVAATVALHPATVGSGAMLVTSASDIARLLKALFIDATGTYAAIGSALLASLADVSATSVLPTTMGIRQLGFGIVRYDTAYICARAGALFSMPGGCAALPSELVVGFAAPGPMSITGGLCASYTNLVSVTSTTSSAVTANARRLCVGTAFASNAGANAVADATVAPMFVAAMNEAFIDPALTEGSTITEADQAPTALYGFLVFVFVVITIFGVLWMSYSTEYFVHPLAVVGPLSSEAYPTLQQHVEKSMAKM